METTLTIQEVAKRTGLSIDTLRYYERIGLLGPIDRTESGHRRYTQYDLDGIELLICMRKIGMPLAQMARMAELRRQDFAATLTERRLLLEEYQHALQEHIGELEQRLATIRRKIVRLKAFEARQAALPLFADTSVQPEAANKHKE